LKRLGIQGNKYVRNTKGLLVETSALLSLDMKSSLELNSFSLLEKLLCSDRVSDLRNLGLIEGRITFLGNGESLIGLLDRSRC
jgi:hypothetical protein